MVEFAGPAPRVAVGVVSSFDFTRDRELWRWAPEDVTLYLARTDAVPMGDSLRKLTDLNDPRLLARPTREVTREPIGSRVVLYSCTACSFVGGPGRERDLRAAMRAAGAPVALTTSGAVVDALAALGAARVAVAHPYLETVGARLAGYLVEAGFPVVACGALDPKSRGTGEVDYATTAELIRRGDHPEADALFVSCTALPTYDLIAPLERELGKPIVTANQAGVWAALGAVGRAATGPGQRLLDTRPSGAAWAG